MQYAVMKEIFPNPASSLYYRGQKALQQQYTFFYTSYSLENEDNREISLYTCQNTGKITKKIFTV